MGGKKRENNGTKHITAISGRGPSCRRRGRLFPLARGRRGSWIFPCPGRRGRPISGSTGGGPAGWGRGGANAGRREGHGGEAGTERGGGGIACHMGPVL